MTFTPQSTRSVVDNITLSIEADTRLEAGEPLRLPDSGVDLTRLNIGGGGHTVTLWIHRDQALRLIGAIVAATEMKPQAAASSPTHLYGEVPPDLPTPEPERERSVAGTVLATQLGVDRDDVPF